MGPTVINPIGSNQSLSGFKIHPTHSFSKNTKIHPSQKKLQRKKSIPFHQQHHSQWRTTELPTAVAIRTFSYPIQILIDFDFSLPLKMRKANMLLKGITPPPTRPVSSRPRVVSYEPFTSRSEELPRNAVTVVSSSLA